jgi:Ca2+-binding RTX toxin-like protein
VSVDNLVAGNYRLVLILNDSGNGSSSKDLHVDLENITVKRTSAPTTQAVVFAALGNVVTDANALVNSSDPWGATDDQGADGASVSAINGVSLSTLSNSTNSTYAAADGYKEYDATYGTLYINADGDYAYVPDANLGNLGQQETFSYTLTQPDGDSDTANLVINLSDSEFVAQAPTSTGTSGDDLMLGTTGDDVLDGAAGDDHIEGGEGDDTLIGGAGNDILIGGEGADIFQWNAGDEGTGDSPAMDIITDFSADEGDSLDLADILQGEESGDITDYISVTQNGSDVVIEVTPDGDGGDMNQVITLENTTVNDLAGTDTSGMSQADIINTLISNGQLNVDQS